jgi:hypothetical protein
MIVGFGYKARVGKDCAADYLCQHFGFQKTGFSEALKAACRVIFHLSEEQLYGDKKELIDEYWNDTPRNILQVVGTECLRRGYSQDVWVRSLGRKLAGTNQNWVVVDCRFPNEANAVKSWGGKVARIDRPGAPGITTPKHVSETSMVDYTNWDYVLENPSDLPQFYANIEVMMKSFGWDK